MKHFSRHAAQALRSRGLWDPARMIETPEPGASSSRLHAQTPFELWSEGAWPSPVTASEPERLPARDVRIGYLDEDGCECSVSARELALAFSLPAPVSAIDAATLPLRYLEWAKRHGVKGRSGQRRDDRQRVRELREVEDLDRRPIERVRVRTNTNPKQADVWGEFDASHPLERMRRSRRSALGADPLRADLRYRAGRLWSRDYDTAHGLTGGGGELGVYVDKSLRPGAGEDARLSAQQERQRIARSKGMTRSRFAVLDAVVGEALAPAEYARMKKLHHSSVREALIGALDLLVQAYPYERLQQVVVLRLDPASRK